MAKKNNRDKENIILPVDSGLSPGRRAGKTSGEAGSERWATKFLALSVLQTARWFHAGHGLARSARSLGSAFRKPSGSSSTLRCPLPRPLAHSKDRTGRRRSGGTRRKRQGRARIGSCGRGSGGREKRGRGRQRRSGTSE